MDSDYFEKCGKAKSEKGEKPKLFPFLILGINGGADGTRTRDLQRDRLAF